MKKNIDAAERGKAQAKQIQGIRNALGYALEELESLQKTSKQDPFIGNKAKSWRDEVAKLKADLEHSRDALLRAVEAAEAIQPKQGSLL